MKTKKFLCVMLAISLLITSLFWGTTSIFAEDSLKDTYSIKITRGREGNEWQAGRLCDLVVTNEATEVEKNSSYYTEIYCENYDNTPDGYEMIISVIMDDGTIIKPETINDNRFAVNIPKVTGNIFISVSDDSPSYHNPDIMGQTYGHGEIVKNLTHVKSSKEYLLPYPGFNENLVEFGQHIYSETFTPEEGYEITEIKTKLTNTVLSKNKGYDFYLEEFPSEKLFINNKDNSYELYFVPSNSIYVEVTATPIATEPIPTDPTKPTDPTPTTPTKPVVKTPTISPATASIKAGTVKALKVKDGKVKSWATSNKKIATVKNGKVTALNKGAVKVTATLTTGKKLTCKVKVTTAPKLQKNKVTVKKGKTVSVKLTGKATSINNKYTNTKRAKIVSKTNAKTIKVKGLKKGTTTLKVKVNGVSVLPIEVQVK